MLRFTVLFINLCLFVAQPLTAQESPEATEADYGELIHGYVPYSWHSEKGKVYLHIPANLGDVLYVNYLSSGLGSNDIGLDRGQIGGERIVRFERVGPKLLLVQPNLDYRALSNNPDEIRAVEEAFAKSVLWGFEIADERDGRMVVDATDFFLRDAHGVTGALRRSNQGDFRLDTSRSAMNLERTKGFPQNSEFDVMLTFTGDRPGGYVRSVAPDPTSFTVHQHHSFVKLPEPGFEMRRFDPRAGVFPHVYRDYAAPIDQPLDQRYIARHRLEKKYPNAERSEPVEPIVYYLDRGTPEPVRSALLEGARWWNQAFDAIGYVNAFRVEMLPPGADPLDVRYNVIQWVHRSTRGWSYGSSVSDPRTGEIIKGHVTLGSLRVRQDFLIAQGLLGPFDDETSSTDALQEMSLARLRQLSAHEVGHTLGFAHNFAASVNNRASVMDYPHPWIQLNNGAIDLSEAYDTGIGEWDKVTVAYAYQDFPRTTDEDRALAEIVDNAIDAGLLFISDRDARPLGGSHPYAHLWDSGADPLEELERILEVRRVALNNFSERNIRIGDPLATLEEVLVPVYLLHRYQVEAAAKLLAGVDYAYTLRGDAQPPARAVDAEKQRAALNTLLRCIGDDVLTLPEHIARLIPPRPYGYGQHRELFDRRTNVTLDSVTIAETGADMVVNLLLDPARCARLVEQHARDPQLPGLAEVLETLLANTVQASRGDGIQHAINQTVDTLVVDALLRLAADNAASPAVRAIAYEYIGVLDRELKNANDNSRVLLSDRIKQFRTHPESFNFPARATTPPGSPIGTDLCTNAGI